LLSLISFFDIQGIPETLLRYQSEHINAEQNQQESVLVMMTETTHYSAAQTISLKVVSWHFEITQLVSDNLDGIDCN
jgi:hypothetical protein